MELAVSLLSTLGINSIVLFFIKRYFDRRDSRERKDLERKEELFRRIDTALETLRLLSYHRMSQEIERLLDQGYASPAGSWTRCTPTTRTTAGTATWTPAWRRSTSSGPTTPRSRDGRGPRSGGFPAAERWERAGM